MQEFTMSDGLVLSARRITSRAEPVALIWEVTSMAGGEAGWRGYGTTLSDAVADLYRAKSPGELTRLAAREQQR